MRAGRSAAQYVRSQRAAAQRANAQRVSALSAPGAAIGSQWVQTPRHGDPIDTGGGGGGTETPRSQPGSGVTAVAAGAAATDRSATRGVVSVEGVGRPLRLHCITWNLNGQVGPNKTASC
jgi:hypothetical protein